MMSASAGAMAMHLAHGDVGLGSHLATTALSEGTGPGAQAAETKNYQAKLLKQINSMKNKEDLLSFVERTHYLLDSINLVTSMYRLARMFSSLQVSQEHRNAWKQDLLGQPCFAILLGAILANLTQAQAVLANNPDASPAATGMNARCLSNLVWSLVKLESAGEEGHPLALEVVCAASPLVLVYLEDCSGQGLANLLWSYAKVPRPYPEVMTAIVLRMVNLLQDPHGCHQLDAQALSNSIWAVAHIRSQPPGNLFAELEASSLWQSAVTHFLLLLAHQCSSMLSQLVDNLQVPRVQPQVVDNDQTFSCQALVNIVWSFSTILGSACGEQDPVRPLFLFVRELMIGKLKASTGGLQLHQPWVYSLSGTFNEQSLVNLVAAYDKAGLLNTPLLQAALDVATQRLARNPMPTPSSPLPFKPQELCLLLRACASGLADPLPFYSTLSRMLSQFPLTTVSWTPAETAEFAQAMQLVRVDAADVQQQQQQAAADAVAQQQRQQLLVQQQQVANLVQQQHQQQLVVNLVPQQQQQQQQQQVVSSAQQQRLLLQLQQPQQQPRRQQLTGMVQQVQQHGGQLQQQPMQHRLSNMVQRSQQQLVAMSQQASMSQPQPAAHLQVQPASRYVSVLSAPAAPLVGGQASQHFDYVTYLETSPRTSSPVHVSGSSAASLHLSASGCHAPAIAPQLSASSSSLQQAVAQAHAPQPHTAPHQLLLRRPLQRTSTDPSPIQQVLQLMGPPADRSSTPQPLPSYELYSLASAQSHPHLPQHSQLLSGGNTPQHTQHAQLLSGSNNHASAWLLQEGNNNPNGWVVNKGGQLEQLAAAHGLQLAPGSGLQGGQGAHYAQLPTAQYLVDGSQAMLRNGQLVTYPTGLQQGSGVALSAANGTAVHAPGNKQVLLQLNMANLQLK